MAVNDLTDTRTNAHLFKYDSSYGSNPGKVEHDENNITIDGMMVRVFSERDPAKIPWSQVGADIVVESTGIFTNAQKAAAHLEGGAKKVIISAPATNEDITLVLGVNERMYNPKEHTGGIQRILHHQLHCSCGESAARQLWDAARLNVHHPLVHQRPAHPRPGA